MSLYFDEHQTQVGGTWPGLLKLEADFGDVGGEQPTPPEDNGLVQHLEWVQDNLNVAKDKLASAYSGVDSLGAAPNISTVRQLHPGVRAQLDEIAAWHNNTQVEIDNVWAALEGWSPKPGNGGEVPPPPPPPPIGPDSFGGSWGAEHNPAFDHYPNGEDGPHGGYIYKCFASGSVERYSFASPLDAGVRHGGLWVVEHENSDGKVSVTSLDLDSTISRAGLVLREELDIIRVLGTQMHIGVLKLDQPFVLGNGQSVRVVWIGHVRSGFATGRRSKGDDFVVCGNSGIEFRVTNPRTGQLIDASHGHVCGSSDGSLTPNGNVDGYWVTVAFGFNPRRTSIPGPAHYISGMYDKGKMIA